MAGLSDAELDRELRALGFQPGPITDSTRELYAKKLSRLRAQRAPGPRPGETAARSLAGLADAELGSELRALGFQPGPITDSTRELYAKKLSRLRAEAAAGRRSQSAGGAPRPEPASASGPRRHLSPLAHRAHSQGRRESEEEEEPPHRDVTGGLNPWALLGKTAAPGGLAPSPQWGAERGFNPSSQCGTRDVRLAPRPQWEIERELAPSTQRGTRDVGLTPSTQWRTRDGGLTPSTQWRTRDGGLTPSTQGGTATVVGGLIRRIPWRTGGEGLTSRSQLTAPKQGAVGKGRGLEFCLSWFLYLATLVLLVIFLGILWVKMIRPGWSLGAEENLKLLTVDCETRTDDFCQAKQKDILMAMLYELYNYLAIQAGSFECGNPEKLKSKCILVSEAKDYVANVTGSSPEKFEDALQWILNSNNDLGIWLKGEDPSEPVTSVDQVVCLESTRPRMGLGCRFRRAISIAIMNLFIFFWSLIALWGILLLLKYHWRKMAEEEQAMYEMVKKIIVAVQDHYKEWEQRLERYPYVGILHVRDTLIPPQSRKKMKRVWNRAVDFLASNESRIQTESHRIAGEDMLVWRWTQPSYVSDSEH
ncbi:LEM domain-containing protein 2 isoform X6 [Dermochelys coriacea]|uniref:LEM domain-containing protein 2 isoform X6 n=1 Tax=Dermochelys coriacea TaxID=27794 RepID=UPI001CA968D6|nr:LEM domain-containing protein 2 isoform X6 [Dermochelys coriacea]